MSRTSPLSNTSPAQKRQLEIGSQTEARKTLWQRHARNDQFRQARQLRQRLAAMTEEDVLKEIEEAEKHAGMRGLNARSGEKPIEWDSREGAACGIIW